MKIEELVPTLKLCKRIPAVEFGDSMFVWRVPEKSCPLEDKFYDITGEIIPDEKPYAWCFYRLFDSIEYERIKRDCILKEKP